MLMRTMQLSSSGKSQAGFSTHHDPPRVLITGGAGYLGSALVPRLLIAGCTVRVLDSFLFGDRWLAALGSHPRLDVIRGDIRDPETVACALEGCDTVVHLAALVGDSVCDGNRALATEINCAATQATVRLCRSQGVRRFLFASTCSVYGNCEDRMEESSPLHPLSHYATTKQDAEAVVLSASTSSFHPTVLRLGTLFGLSPRPRFDLLINRLTVQAACARKIVIYNGEQWRPFVHVADAARGFEICMNASPSLVSGEIYNLADDSLNLRLSEISRKIEAIVPTVTIEYKENEDKRSYRASCRKIRNRLGFVSMYSVEYGIQEILYALLESASPRELSLIAAASQDLKLAPAGAAHVQAAGRR